MLRKYVIEANASINMSKFYFNSYESFLLNFINQHLKKVVSQNLV